MFPQKSNLIFILLRSLSGRYQTYPDGTKFVGVGILPDIEVKETVSSYLSIAQSDVDNTLATAKAIELLKSIIRRK